ncbi:hypothetical protein GCM10018790_18930 [Kitasatospora xanthocidica]|nr:hypothetical protein GCM10018790_18930 [Kitasatospora xanthocidica]
MTVKACLRGLRCRPLAAAVSGSAAAAEGAAATAEPPTMAAPAAVAADRVTKSRRFRGMDDSPEEGDGSWTVNLCT